MDGSGPIHNLPWLGMTFGLFMRTQVEETTATCYERESPVVLFLGPTKSIIPEKMLRDLRGHQILDRPTGFQTRNEATTPPNLE